MCVCTYMNAGAGSTTRAHQRRSAPSSADHTVLSLQHVTDGTFVGRSLEGGGAAGAGAGGAEALDNGDSLPREVT